MPQSTRAIARLTLPLGLVLPLANIAQADLNDWAAEVAAGTPATFVQQNPMSQSVVNIGAISDAGGASYEFIVNAQSNGIFSTALLGYKEATVPQDFGVALKFEQYNLSGEYGVTDWMVEDYNVGSTRFNQDVHLVFVVDPGAGPDGTTTIYENGVFEGQIDFGQVLSGINGLGQWYDPVDPPLDPLIGMILGVATYDSMLSSQEIAEHYAAFQIGPIGTNYCGPALPNTLGIPGRMEASGLESVAANNVTLAAKDMPNGQFGIFINGRAMDFNTTVNPNGVLCISSAPPGLGRYNRLGELQTTGMTGSFELALDLGDTPTPGGSVPILGGETWYFQGWYRDFIPGQGAISNFTDAVEISFQN